MLMRPKMSSGVGLEKKERKGFNYRRQKNLCLIASSCFLSRCFVHHNGFFPVLPTGEDGNKVNVSSYYQPY